MNNAIHEAVSAIEAAISEIDGTGISDKTLGCVREKSKIVRSHVTTYDTAAILRQNVADMERELQRQRDRADKAEAKLKAAMEQEPVAWLSAENYKRICPGLGKTVAIKMNKVKPDDVPLYSAHFHAAPAPAVPEEWKSAAADAVYAMRWWAAQEDGVPEEVAPVFMKLHTLLGWSISCAADQSAVRALLQSAPASSVPAPAVPEEWREVMAGLVAIAEKKGKKQGSPNHCHKRPGVWDDDNGPALSGKPCAECAMYDKARALLQSAGGGK